MANVKLTSYRYPLKLVRFYAGKEDGINTFIVTHRAWKRALSNVPVDEIENNERLRQIDERYVSI